MRVAWGGKGTHQGKDTLQPSPMSPALALWGLPPVSHGDTTVYEGLEMGLRLELKPGQLCLEATAALCSQSDGSGDRSQGRQGYGMG